MKIKDGDDSMNLFLASLGCAKNQVDSEAMLGRLCAAGWRITPDPARATVIIVNTCGFITAAADESIDTILSLARYKTSGVCRRLIVTGCLPERYRKPIAKALPEVDLFLGTGAFDQIVMAAGGGLLPAGGCMLPDPEALAVDAPQARIVIDPVSAPLKVAEGCDRHCTFCIIPRLRGRFRSRPADALAAEARRLVEGGIRELTLVAQETTAWGRDLAPATDLAALLDILAPQVAPAWLRVLYGHPASFDPAVTTMIQRHANICPYFDIPIQHAADRVLQRMARGYDREYLRRIFGEIRQKLPEAALRTTVIVGFPGETDQDITALLDFLEEIRFAHLGVFIYSDADDLPSHGLKSKPSARIREARYDAVMACQADISAANLRREKGREVTVLVEEASPRGCSGRTACQAPEVDGMVLLPANEQVIPGLFKHVRITGAQTYDLSGEWL